MAVAAEKLQDAPAMVLLVSMTHERTNTATLRQQGPSNRHLARRIVALGLAGLIAFGGTVTLAGAEGRSGRPPSQPPTKPLSIAPIDADTDAGPNVLAPAPPSKAQPSGPDQLAALSPSGFTLTGVSATAHGTWAKFRYTTNAEYVTLRVSDHQPKLAHGVWTEPYMDGIIGPEVLDTTKPGVASTYNNYVLLPGTTYYYIITVPTAANEVPVQAVGSFTTLRRTLTITFDTVHVTDDSDPGAKGAGDFTFWFRVNGKPVGTVSKDIKSDSTYAIKIDGKPLRVVIPDVLHTDVPFGVQLFENDIQSWDTCNHELLAGGSWDGVAIGKENDCGTWAGMVDQYDAGPSHYKIGYSWRESETIVFQLSPYQSSVHLTVTGTITAVWA